jgi:thiosulfate reductase cytochrome b subunit
MEESPYLPALGIQVPDALDSPQHSGLVRVSHWIHTLSFFALMVSGVAILLAHPRLYWGETGGVGSPSLIDLPLPFVLTGQTGWARSLHFLAAWVCVLNGMLYLFSGLIGRHFRRDLLPSKADLAWRNISRVASNHLHFKLLSEEDSNSYNVLQRLAYLGVVFVLSPLIVLTGLAMSPSITSVFPALVTSFGGQQSARTIHFFVASLLVIFLIVHVVMVCIAGFTSRMRAMITGRNTSGKELA